MTSISKTQIDRLGDRLRKGEFTDDDLRLLDAYRASFAEPFEEAVATVCRATGLQPSDRSRKTPLSIIQKLRRLPTLPLSRMQDIAGCRVVVADIAEQDQVAERLASAFARAKVIDRRARPSYGYRAVHIVVTVRDKPVEIQVRTELQNFWAQLSEVMSDRTDARIKYGGGNPNLLGILSFVSSWIDWVEAGEQEQAKAEAMLNGLTGAGWACEVIPLVQPLVGQERTKLAQRKTLTVELLEQLVKEIEVLTRKGA